MEILPEHKHYFVPLWMPIVAFILIFLVYVYCDMANIPINSNYRIGALGISGFFAIVCAYLYTKRN